MNDTETLDSDGVMEEQVGYPNIILLQALVDSSVDADVGELNIDGLQQYQIINGIPNFVAEQVSVISSGTQISTLVPVHLGIKQDAPAPSGNVKSKTWVPDSEKAKLENLERQIKRVLPGSSETSRVKRNEKKYSTGQPTSKKIVDNGGENPESNKESKEYCLKNLLRIHDKPAQPRAFATLPDELQYQRGLVSPRRALPKCVRFGPVEGIDESMNPAAVQELVTIMSGSPLFLHTCENDNSMIHINVMDQDKCNWIGLLPLGDDKTANVWILQCDNELYGVTLKPIPASTPLRLGYSKEYAEKYGVKGPTVDIFAELKSVQPSHWCNDCSRLFPTGRHLELHHAKYHVQKPAGAYRCRLCATRFTRRFALKRHLRLNCKKSKGITGITSQISSESKSRPPTQNGGFGSQQNGADDSNRLPSDESLQNYTNILDISTNLFDTDRMPNLDISGSVKSDNEFNPLVFKDDSHLANDFSFANGLMDDLVVGDTPQGPQDAKKSPSKVRSSSPFSCPYCKINMPRSKLKQHSKNCMAQRFDCVCGRKYRSKGKMEAHIRVCDIVKDSKELDNPYSCAECNMAFKRRGMYVNHVTNRHGAGAVPEPPLVVPDRRYPCPDCSKLYKTQAKRHAHVLAQHPGLKYDQSKRLVCGSKAVQPAKCWACPKQYGTRSKLLQHARKQHPDTEPPAPFIPPPKKAR